MRQAITLDTRRRTKKIPPIYPWLNRYFNGHRLSRKHRRKQQYMRALERRFVRRALRQLLRLEVRNREIYSHS